MSVARPKKAFPQPLDLLFLGTLGLGTIAWLARRHIFGTSSPEPTDAIKPSDLAPTETPVAKMPAEDERDFVSIMKKQHRRVIFFYGSQTGTAEDYASRLAKECTQRYGVGCMVGDLELYDLKYLDTVPEDFLVVFVLATYGEGEPTDNAVEFWEFLTNDPVFTKTESPEELPLRNLRYLAFGLGNKTYEHYNAVIRRVDKALSELGGTRIGERGEGDDDASLEEDFMAWQESMWPSFCKALGVDENAVQSGPRQPTYAVTELDTFDEGSVYHGELAERLKSGEQPTYDAKHPFSAPVKTRDLFLNADRHCLHVDIDISDSNLTYQTGDHVAIWPTNNEVEVNRLATVLGLQEKLDTVVMVKAIDPSAPKQHPFPVPTTYRTIFRHYLDIAAPASRQVLQSFVEYCPTEESKALLLNLATDKDAYHLQVIEAVRNVGEVLEMVSPPSTSGFFSTIPVDLLIESLVRLQPRYYSISSSSLESRRMISATAVTLAYQPDPTPDRTVYGVTTNFLWQLHAGNEPGVPEYHLGTPKEGKMRIPMHVRKSTFRLPNNPSKPVIMVGPGTGVAPFRAFVRERALLKSQGKNVGPTILYFGCRNSQQDFLYKEEWPGLFETLGAPSRIITAFSRENPGSKVYVQHRLRENGAEMWELIMKGAFIYVCGDARNMARDVQQTFIDFAMVHGNKTNDEAMAFIKRLRNSGRYQEDVWS